MKLSVSSVLASSTLLLFVAACGGGSSSHEASEPEPPAPVTTEQAPEPQPSEEVKLVNTIRWSTASEVDNFGYDVYRADAEEGPFERITEEPVPGAGTTDSPTAYSFEDENIDPTKPYWYYVESISLSNERERFTPIIRAKPKKPVEGEEEAPTTDENA